MSTYVIALQKTIHDPALLDEYRRRVIDILPKYGATMRIRGGAHTVLMGEAIERVVMLEFESAERARAWYYSPEYQDALKLLQASTVTHAVMAEGV